MPEKKSVPIQVSVSALSKLLDCPYYGKGTTLISGVSNLKEAEKGDLVFLAHRKFQSQLEHTKASAAIIPIDETYDRIPVIKSKNPQLSFLQAVEYFFQPHKPALGIHSLAYVSPTAKVGKDVSIGAFVFIGDEVEIGNRAVIFPFVAIYPHSKVGRDCIIHSHVSIREETFIGNRVIIHNGAVIGSDGFGYIQDTRKAHVKIPQIGNVVIQDNVEIGANTTIDRASLGKTIIRKGTKIDNLVQVAHNVEIGSNVILAAQTGIAGSSIIGKKVMVGGQVGIADHVEIGDNVILAAKSGVSKDIPANSMVGGSPHLDMREWQKACLSIPQLYDMLKEIKKLKKKIEALEKAQR
ncbi:MAG: UDP-3-O-(3-hydroxymyristoyl)glucosamine N-acyltransferase [Candidatus Aminicenantes bacterium]|nr:MAG: UDP-3-O-(3-hydroxymyristoyl)glucosamine N-acyltransferase [Candidatus Aminicenantes bacterium]